MEVARQMCALAIEDWSDQNAYNWLSDGCWAKAMKTHDVVEKRLGIKLDRVWLYGYNSSAPLNYFSKKHSCSMNWYYHTAPIAYVREPDGSVQQYVIDPAIAGDFNNQPLRLDHWESLITESNPARIQYKFIVSGWIYVPGVGFSGKFLGDEGGVDSHCVVYGTYRENLFACDWDEHECFNRGCLLLLLRVRSLHHVLSVNTLTICFQLNAFSERSNKWTSMEDLASSQAKVPANSFMKIFGF